MGEKFLGIGLYNAFGLFLFFVLLIVVTKVVTLKSDKVPDGLRNIVQTI